MTDRQIDKHILTDRIYKQREKEVGRWIKQTNKIDIQIQIAKVRYTEIDRDKDIVIDRQIYRWIERQRCR